MENSTENTDATNETPTEKRRPDYTVHFEREYKGKKELIRFGAAWNHKDGGGMSVTLAHGGRLVLFPNKPRD